MTEDLFSHDKPGKRPCRVCTDFKSWMKQKKVKQVECQIRTIMPCPGGCNLQNAECDFCNLTLLDSFDVSPLSESTEVVFYILQITPALQPPPPRVFQSLFSAEISGDGVVETPYMLRPYKINSLILIAKF